jgi:1,2-dihydroxy-3-keto-5-methylthiopentene dioxygenase
MTMLTVTPESGGDPAAVYGDFADIQKQLDGIGILLERWEADRPLGPDAVQDDVLAAYAGPVARLKDAYGFQSADVIAVSPETPGKEALREKFLSEHTHADHEVRFFIAGRGLFFLHPDERVFGVLCDAGDLISVPAGTRHWFDMGAEPDLRCIRLFTTPEGWVADYTGSDIADRFPTLDTYLSARA